MAGDYGAHAAASLTACQSIVEWLYGATGYTKNIFNT